MLANIGVLHPQVVHFVIALLIVGVALRVASLIGIFKFTGPAATTLIIVGTIAAWLAVTTGEKAHPPVERIPGVREAVQEHEEWGERTRNLFTIVALLEIAAVVAARKARSRLAKGLAVASGLIGLGGIAVVYETAEHGGALVYDYAGGPGVRSGRSEDVRRLLVAGLYNNAMLARREQRGLDAAAYIDQLARLRPGDPSIRLLAVESTLRDRNDPRAALNALAQLPPPETPRQGNQRDLLRADAHAQLGHRDSALAIVEALLREQPDNRRLRAKADSLRSR